ACENGRRAETQTHRPNLSRRGRGTRIDCCHMRHGRIHPFFYSLAVAVTLYAITTSFDFDFLVFMWSVDGCFITFVAAQRVVVRNLLWGKNSDGRKVVLQVSRPQCSLRCTNLLGCSL